MRYVTLILCGLLSACCAKQPKEYTVIREVSRPAKVVEQPVELNQPIQQPVILTGVQTAPTIPSYYATLNGAPVVYYQDVPMMGEMVVMGEMEMEQPVVQPAVYQSPAMPEMVQMDAVPAGVSYSEDMAHCVVVLQHPQGRDLVRCLNTDFTCIQSYEKLGYVQLRHTPHFAGSEDMERKSDYPARQWRSDNNIPRW